MIDVSGLTKEYGSTRAVAGISFTVNPGEVVGLLGPNGAGKSTTLRVLTGYLPPTAGSVKMGGVDVLENPLEVRRRVGYLSETNPLYESLGVWESLTLFARLREIHQADRAIVERHQHSLPPRSKSTRIKVRQRVHRQGGIKAELRILLEQVRSEDQDRAVRTGHRDPVTLGTELDPHRGGFLDQGRQQFLSAVETPHTRKPLLAAKSNHPAVSADGHGCNVPRWGYRKPPFPSD